MIHRLDELICWIERKRCSLSFLLSSKVIFVLFYVARWLLNQKGKASTVECSGQCPELLVSENFLKSFCFFTCLRFFYIVFDWKAQVTLPPSGLHLSPPLVALFCDSYSVFGSKYLLTVLCLLTNMLWLSSLNVFIIIYHKREEWHCLLF